MRIHHLNCVTMCPPGGRLMDGRAGFLGPAALTCHCLLLETDRGLVMIDTGFGLNDVMEPTPRLSKFFLATCRPALNEGQTADGHATFWIIGDEQGRSAVHNVITDDAWVSVVTAIGGQVFYDEAVVVADDVLGVVYE